jgi:glycosyltransferase involved in cell wall biosynthesis
MFTEHGRFHPDRHRYTALPINPLMPPAIVSISEATRESLVRYEFIPRTKIRESLGIPEEAFVVGTVSRLDPVKNQPMMLRAFQSFSECNPNAWLLMVGGGPDRQHLEQLAIQLQISKRTVFTGYVNKPAQHPAAMDVFLLSSHTEGASMTLLEAMSLRIPPVEKILGATPRS